MKKRFGRLGIAEAFPLSQEVVNWIVVGGCFLGGGGGGSMEAGKKLGNLALEVGLPSVVPIDAFSNESVIVTVSAVGAPAASEQFCTPMDYVRALKLLMEQGVQVAGINTSENGGLASVNGWFQSAVLGIPVVDAPCNGRAHPMGVMGSMGLHKVEGYVSVQAAVGGNPKKGKYTEMVITTSLTEAARLVRQASITAGGMVAVARNPVSAEYVKANGARGALSQAVEVGKRILKGAASSPRKAVTEVLDYLGGEVVAEGEVTEFALNTKEGFDVGKFLLATGKELIEVTFWNEFMTIDRAGKRVGTFPDLISVMDVTTGMPVPSAELKSGQKVFLIWVPKSQLILGQGMRDPDLLQEASKIVGKQGGWTC
ncbi:MAG: DUF917 family protein [Spirochaetales bacterium]